MSFACAGRAAQRVCWQAGFDAQDFTYELARILVAKPVPTFAEYARSGISRPDEPAATNV
jgi:hypothetical protein